MVDNGVKNSSFQGKSKFPSKKIYSIITKENQVYEKQYEKIS